MLKKIMCFECKGIRRKTSRNHISPKKRPHKSLKMHTLSEINAVWLKKSRFITKAVDSIRAGFLTLCGRSIKTMTNFNRNQISQTHHWNVVESRRRYLSTSLLLCHILIHTNYLQNVPRRTVNQMSSFFFRSLSQMLFQPCH